MTTPATKASAAPTPIPFSFGSTSQPMPATALQTNIPASGAGFSFGVTPVGGTTTPMASVSPTPAPLSFGSTPQPMPITASQTNVPASSSAGVSLSFGAGAASTAPAFWSDSITACDDRFFIWSIGSAGRICYPAVLDLFRRFTHCWRRSSCRGGTQLWRGPDKYFQPRRRNVILWCWRWWCQC